MKKRLIAALLTIGMMATLVVGCANSSEEDAAETTDAAVEETEEETAEAVTVGGTVTFNIDISQYEKGQVVRVWLPVAQSDDYQTITDVVTEANGAEAVINEDDLGNQMMYVEWGADAEPADRTASLSFHAVRQEIVCPELVEEGTAGEEFDEYLGASKMVQVTGMVKELADEITKDETTYLGKARAIYDWVIANMNRNNDIVGCGDGDVCRLLDVKEGKCTDINSVFVGLCRAAGVPAREMFGVRMNDVTLH